MLGYSEIGRRRILPAMARCGITSVDIASRSAAGTVVWPEEMQGFVFDDYAEAIRRSEAGLVWVSTVNARHAELAKAALEAGRHVMIDKPATTSLADAQNLVDLARQRNLVLAEANVYAFHPQIAAARQFFADTGSAPTQMVAAFSFPPFPPENFRRHPEMGGGALLDLGPYAMSLGRIFYAAAPEEVISRKLDGDRGFSVLAVYSGNRSLVGHFGHSTGYINRLNLLGQGTTLNIERAFTTTPEMACRLTATANNAASTIEIQPADSYAVFMEAVLAAVQRCDVEAFLPALLADAKAIELLRS
jgi:predicted dehydrogenase